MRKGGIARYKLLVGRLDSSVERSG
ncbi:conserved hypothetical protein [Brucella melitensis M5-90]|nr:conserved hypothetical protein [Brucella melitensis M5-90]